MHLEYAQIIGCDEVYSTSSIIEGERGLPSMETGEMRKYMAECLGTFVLTFFGCGSVIFGGATLGTVGIALTFGLSIIAMAFVIGDISGCHVNPAVSLGMFLDGRLSSRELFGYWIAQIIGAIIAAAILALLVTCSSLFATCGGVAASGLGCDGFGSASSVGIDALGAFIVELILTCVFVLAVLGSTASRTTAPFAGLIIGLTLTFVHLVGIPLTGTSVNPARSIGPALMMGVCGGDWTAFSQLCLFIIAPLVGAVLAALIWKAFRPAPESK